MTSLATPISQAKLSVTHSRFTVAELIQSVNLAVEQDGVEGVARVLEHAIAEHPQFLPNRFLVPKVDGYARREIYSDPQGRFSILVMVWAPGQGTLLHDHGGLWVVEAVYQGLINITNYEHVGVENDLHQFKEIESRLDDHGVSGNRVPPDEYHLLRNAGNVPAVTIHVFGGILKECNVFEPVEGGFRKLHKLMQVD